jgi:hypothetical protein
MKIEEKKSELFVKLQKAVELELSTIPPYLMAMFSIQPETNVASSVIIRSVFMEEMLHLTLAANIFSATGGKVSLGKGDIPSYPLELEFRGQNFKDRELNIHLEAFSKSAISTFMQIELPDNFAPTKSQMEKSELEISGFTIGDFYREINQDLIHLCEEFGEKAVFSGNPQHQISEQYYWHGGGRPIVVTNLEAASQAIDVITDQGEGASGSLFDGDKHIFDQPAEVAHYFRFNEIDKQRYYKPTDQIHDDPSGEPLPVNYEQVFPIKTDCKSTDYESDAQLQALNRKFNARYSLMLAQLEEGFNGNPAVFYTAIMNGMHGLPSIAQTMVQLPIKGDPEKQNGAPTFEWVSPDLNLT